MGDERWKHDFNLWGRELEDTGKKLEASFTRIIEKVLQRPVEELIRDREFILEKLHHGRELEALQAVEFLSIYWPRHEETVDILVDKAFNGSSPYVRNAALMALNRFPTYTLSRQVIVRLCQCCLDSSEDSKFRESAALCLNRLSWGAATFDIGNLIADVFHVTINEDHIRQFLRQTLRGE